MTLFELPDLGEGLQEAEIVQWHVSVGDRVARDQPLVSVETDKAVVEVPAPWPGTVVEMFAEAGETVPVGAPLIAIRKESGADDPGTPVGRLPEQKVVTDQQTRPRKGPDRQRTDVKATPAIRRKARELGIDLAKIKGTGPDGAVIGADLETQVVNGWRPLHGVRRTMAGNMAKAHKEVAATTVMDVANVTAWMKDQDVTVRLVRAIVKACGAVPALNAWFDGRKEASILHENIDLGIATHTEDGLFVPVLRDVGKLEEDKLRSALDRLKQQVRQRVIPAEDLHGQTITLSNFGTVGGRHAALIIVPPQVAILGAGRITKEPRVENDSIVVGSALPLSLTFDHRAVTGAEATAFLMTVIRDLEG